MGIQKHRGVVMCPKGRKPRAGADGGALSSPDSCGGPGEAGRVPLAARARSRRDQRQQERRGPAALRRPAGTLAGLAQPWGPLGSWAPIPPISVNFLIPVCICFGGMGSEASLPNPLYPLK